ncbi:Cytohesin-1, partial [Geodia barretti]
RTQRCRLNNRNVAARSAEKSWKNPLKEQESLKMPRGGRTRGHKGRPKHYLTREEIEAEEQRKKKESEWKRRKGGGPGEEGEEEEEESVSVDEGVKERGAQFATRPVGTMPSSSSSEDEDEDEDEEEDEEPKAKGVEALIEISNPNRVANKSKKASQIDVNAKVELSRREREEIARQRSVANYRKLHEAGKTEEAQRDLARLAIIRQKREEAAKKKEEELKAIGQSEPQASPSRQQQPQKDVKRSSLEVPCSNSPSRSSAGGDSLTPSELSWTGLPEDQQAVERLQQCRKQLEEEIDDMVDELTRIGEEMNCTSECLQILRDSDETPQKKDLRRARKIFKNKPKDAIKFLLEKELLNDTPEDVALYLFCNGMDKTALGDYLGEGKEFNIKVLQEFVRLHKFHGMDLVRALRGFLGSFQLPGEAQKIDRMMESFASQ